MSRGGPYNRGRRLSTNTSGLSAIRFEWRPSRDGAWEYPYVCVSWIDASGHAKRASYSVERHGADGALGRAISRRLAAGHQPPTLATCHAALERFLKAA